MSNALMASRDRFVSEHAELRMRVNGREWGALRAGDEGPVLLLLPGTLGRGDIFWQQIEALRGRARILTLSYPDSGGITEWSTDIEELLDHFKLDRVLVLGSSLGGFLAQFVAASHPQRITGLVAANTLSAVPAAIRQMPPYAFDLATAPLAQIQDGFSKGMQAWAAGQPGLAALLELLLLDVNGRICGGELRARLQALKDAPHMPRCPLPPARAFSVESADDHLIAAPVSAAVRDWLQPHRTFRFLWGGHFPYVLRPVAYCALIEEALGLAVTAQPWPAGILAQQ